MSLPDYEIHLNSKQYSDLWGPEDEQSTPPFFEDPEELDRMIEEEIGKPRWRRKRKKVPPAVR